MGILNLYLDWFLIVSLAKTLVYHGKTRHIVVRYHVIQENIVGRLEKVVSRENATNALTKGLPRDVLDRSYHLIKGFVVL